MNDEEIHDYVNNMNTKLMELAHENYQTAVEALMCALTANLRTISMNDPSTFEYNAEHFMGHMAEMLEETKLTIDHDQPTKTIQ